MAAPDSAPHPSPAAPALGGDGAEGEDPEPGEGLPRPRQELHHCGARPGREGPRPPAPRCPSPPPLLTLLCPRAQGLQYAYRDRRTKKREFRSLWISRINAGAREHGYSYSRFTHGQNQAGIVLNRKILAELAVYEPWSFKSIVDVVRASEEAGTDSEQSAQMQQDLILDRISMAAADPAEAKERLGAYNG